MVKYEVRYVRNGEVLSQLTQGEPRYTTATEAGRLAERRSSYSNHTYLVKNTETNEIVAQYRHGQRFK